MTEKKSTGDPSANPDDAPDNVAQTGDSEDPTAEVDIEQPDLIEERFEDVVAQRDQYLEMARRARAELENYQKRVSREQLNERKFAAQPLMTDLLPAIDNLERALESGESHEDATGVVDGVRIVLKQFVEVFDRHGAVQTNPAGMPFDPNQHQAVSQQPTNEQPPMTVLTTLQKGYTLHDRVIRPARVIVAGPVDEPAEAASDE